MTWAEALATAIEGIADLDRSKLLLFGGWQSASRGTGSTIQMVAERLGIVDQFQGVDKLTVNADGSLEVLERIEAGNWLASKVESAPAAFGWATGELPEPPNNPQVGMMNMKSIMPALQQAKPAKLDSGFRVSGVSPAADRCARRAWSRTCPWTTLPGKSWTGSKTRGAA